MSEKTEKEVRGGEKEGDGHLVIPASLSCLLNFFFHITNVMTGEPEQPGENLMKTKKIHTSLIIINAGNTAAEGLPHPREEVLHAILLLLLLLLLLPRVF